MAKITAKVTCTWKAPGESSTQLYFGPDYAEGRNAQWASATPSLSLSMTVKNEVADQFTTGGHYTLTFEPEAEESAAEPDDSHAA
jgi:hypothetical protein